MANTNPLAEAMKAQGRKQTWLASQLGVRQPTVSTWSRGLAKPHPRYWPRLKVLLGIPPEAWLSDDIRAALSVSSATANDSDAPTKAAA